MKNILLTGSGGFIGSHLKNYLSEKFNLLMPRSYELNLLDKQELKKYFENHKIDFIIHSAAFGVRITPNVTLQEVAKPNLEMFDNLSEYVNKNRPMITFGSGAEYDKSNPIINVKEIEFDKSIPKDPYGYSKYIISKKIEEKKHILNLRIFGIYGYGEHPSRVTSCIINDNISKNPIILNQNVKFHFIWIDDFCKIVGYFINSFPNEKFINVTPNESIEIKDLAEIVNGFSEYKSEIVVKKEGLNKEYTGDNSLLLKCIPNLKFISYKDGMEKLYNMLKN